MTKKKTYKPKKKKILKKKRPVLNKRLFYLAPDDFAFEQAETGRPSVITPETLKLLRTAYLYGANDRQACMFARISESSFYAWQVKNPWFTDQKEAWKNDPILKAKRNVVAALRSKDEEIRVKTSSWMLERRQKDEFSPRQELAGAIAGVDLSKDPNALSTVLKTMTTVMDNVNKEVKKKE